MTVNTPPVTPWAAPISPTESTLRQLCAGEGLKQYPWSGKPQDVFPAQMHSHDKVIYVVHGSIPFNLPQLGKQNTLKTGNRLDLPAGILHDSVVGSKGFICLEPLKI